MYKLIRLISNNRLATVFFVHFLLILPKELILFACKISGWLLAFFALNLKKRVISNIREIFPKQFNNKELKAFCQDYFQNLLLTLVEILIYSRDIDKLDHLIEVEGQDNLEEALKLGRGVILYAPHVSNFFYYYYYVSQRYPSLTVATALDEDLHHLYLIFHRLGCQGLDYDSTNKREMLKQIKSHLAQNGVLLLYGDFWRKEFPQSVMFGKSTRLPSGTAALSLDLEVPVIPFFGFRTKNFQHKIVFQEPIYLFNLYAREQKSEATIFLNGFLEKIIGKVSSQWFYWFNCDERWESKSTNRRDKHPVTNCNQK